MLSLGQLFTDDTNDNDDDNNNANDDNSDTWWTNHDCIDSLACMPNEPKSTRDIQVLLVFLALSDTKEHVQRFVISNQMIIKL